MIDNKRPLILVAAFVFSSGFLFGIYLSTKQDRTMEMEKQETAILEQYREWYK